MKLRKKYEERTEKNETIVNQVLRGSARNVLYVLLFSTKVYARFSIHHPEGWAIFVFSALACNLGSWCGVLLKRDQNHLHLKRPPALASVSRYFQANTENTKLVNDESRYISVKLVSAFSLDINICSFQFYWANTLRGVLSTGERTFREASIIEHAMWATFSAWLSHGFGRPPTTI